MKYIEEISLDAFDGFRVGNAEYTESGTGCTVILAEKGAVTGIDIRGGAPASRESGLLNPLAANNGVHAVILSGSSAFGLQTAEGAVRWLEERNIGFPTGFGVVPIVCASCLFDLGAGTSEQRADADLAYEACVHAGNFREGNYGAGCGATVGKVLGGQYAMKSGIGYKGYQCGGLKVGAIVAVNAVGDVYDPDTHRKTAGMYDRDAKTWLSAEEAIYGLCAEKPDLFQKNTTIGVILTNGSFNKTELTKIAGMAHDGYARSIVPVHTQFDGDSIYAMSSGGVSADLNAAGTLAARCMAEAIVSACTHANSAYGFPACSDL